METNWIKTVKRVFKENRATNKNYKFKNALIDAKKIYKNTTRTVDSMGPALANKLAKKIKRTMKKRGGNENPNVGNENNYNNDDVNNVGNENNYNNDDVKNEESQPLEQQSLDGGKKKSKKSKKSKTSKKSKK